VRGYPEWFFFMGQGEWLGAPTQLWLLGVAIVIAGVALDRTTFGRALYAIGSNETAARFSGLPVDRIKLRRLHALRPDGGRFGLGAGLAGDDDALRHGHRLRARRDRRRGAGRDQHLSAAPARSGAR
jgi:predicted ABC-type sugar transport system permease subunit